MKPPARTVLFYFVYALVAAFAITGTLFCFFIPLQFPNIWAPMAGAGIGFILAVFLFYLKNKARWLWGAAFIAYGAAVVLNWQPVWLGAKVSAQVLAAQFSLVFPQNGQVAMPAFTGTALAGYNTFSLLACIPFAAYIYWAVGQRASLGLCLLGTVPLFAFPFNLYGMPHVLGFMLLLCAWLALGLTGQTKPAKNRHSAKVSLGALTLAAVYFACMIVAFPPGGYSPWLPVFTARKAITNAMEAIEYYSPFGSVPGSFSGSPLSGRQGHVNLANTGNLRFGDGTALLVRGNLNGTHYLRGFSASVYTGNGWQALPQNIYNSSRFNFQPLSLSNFFEQYASSTQNYLEVENLEGNTGYCFTPYFLQSVKGENGTFPFVQDAYVAPLHGQNQYTSYYWELDILNPNTFLNVGQQYYLSINPDWYYYVQAPEGYLYYTLLPDGVPPNELGTYELPYEFSDEAYGEYDTEYTRFIKETYLQLPDDTKQSMLELAAAATLESGPFYQAFYSGEQNTYYSTTPIKGIKPAVAMWDWPRVAAQVAFYVRSVASYTLTPGRQPRAQDFATYFLTESNQGYCMHFATAATCMLRALGVPARYVEGYVVSAKPANTAKWVSVPEKNAHAWVEIWFPSFGWLPLEVTPGGADALQTEEEHTSQNGSETAASGNAAAPETTPASSYSSSAGASSKSEGGANTGGQAPLRGKLAFWAGSILVLVAAAYLLLLHNTRAQRKKSFAQSNTNNAALAIYTYLCQLQKWGYSPSGNATALAGKARFSQHTLTKTEYAALLQEGLAARQATKQNLPWYKKLWLYLSGL